MYKQIAIILACLCLVLLFYSYKQKTNDVNTIIVGTNTEFPPFAFRDHNEIVGFDIDIAKEVVKRMCKEITFKDMPFDALIPDLSFGNIDFIAAGMSYTDERAQRVSFTRPYLTNDPLVILTVAKSGPYHNFTINDFTNKTVVVNEGYTADIYLSDKTGFNLVRLSAPADAFLALKNGRADAFVTAESTVHSFLETQNATQFQMDVISGANETCAIVVAKKNSKLLADIQKVLDNMEKDGTMDQLKQKWKLT